MAKTSSPLRISWYPSGPSAVVGGRRSWMLWRTAPGGVGARQSEAARARGASAESSCGLISSSPPSPAFTLRAAGLVLRSGESPLAHLEHVRLAYRGLLRLSVLTSPPSHTRSTSATAPTQSDIPTGDAPLQASLTDSELLLN